MADPVLSLRALNRATLARQSLLERSSVAITDALEDLVGLQAQTPHSAYTGLWSRLAGFRPEALSDLIMERRVVRLALMRGTIHMVTARDAWGLRSVIQPVLDRVQKGQSGKALAGVDVDAVTAMGRAFLDERPQTFKALGDHLLTRWPGRDRFALEQAVRTGVPLIQVPPRGLWGRSGPIAHTSIEAWLGEPPAESMTLDAVVLRYLGAFGPATVMDAQAWCGLTKLGEVLDRLRQGLVTFRDERGRELFDLPGAPRPDADTPAPPRFLYDFDNLLLSHADRSRVIPPGLARPPDARSQDQLSTFTIDGFVAGTWGIDRAHDVAGLVLKPGRPLFLAAGASTREVRIVRA
jgi:hypothetical protein